MPTGIKQSRGLPTRIRRAVYHRTRRGQLVAALCAVATTNLALSANASMQPGSQQAAGDPAAYPSRPVRFIIPFPPSGGTDIVGRIVGQKLSEKLGQQFVIDNRPGAASTLGSAVAARAAPDGYTLLLVTASFAIAADYYKHLPYDPGRDFSAVCQIASAPLVFVVHPSVPAHTIAELIALAKAHPGGLNYASGGPGGINQLAAEMFNTMTGTRITHIPYKGAGPALAALLSNEVQLMIATLGSTLTDIRTGRVRALAAASAERTALLPDLPTAAESGLPGYAADNWYGIVVPHGTMREIIELLNQEMVAVLGSEDVRERFAALGFETVSSNPDEFEEYLASQIRKWGQAIKEAGISQR